MTTAGKTFKIIGNTGLKQQGGIILEEFNPELRGPRGREALQRMADTDPVVAGILFAIDMLMRQTEWSVQPYDESPEAEEDRAFIEECFDDMSVSWEDTLSEILSMLVHGFSYFEILYKRRVGPNQKNATSRSRYTDGKIGWRKFSPRSQDSIERWEFDDEGGIAGVWQLGFMQYQAVFIPIEKSLLFRTTVQKSNPEGTSTLRSAYSSYYYQKNIQRIEAIGIERDLTGLPVMEVPEEIMRDDASPHEKQMYRDCQDMVTMIRRDEQEGVIIPQKYDLNGNPMFKLTLLSTGGSRQFDTDSVIARYDQRKAMALLADFILLGHENVGSMSLSQTKVGMFQTALKAWLDGIAGVFNQHAIPRLMRLNGRKGEFAPSLVASDIEESELTEVVNALVNLVKVGMVGPSDELERYLLDKMGLPYQEPEERLVPPYMEHYYRRDQGQDQDQNQNKGSNQNGSKNTESSGKSDTSSNPVEDNKGKKGT